MRHAPSLRSAQSAARFPLRSSTPRRSARASLGRCFSSPSAEASARTPRPPPPAPRPPPLGSRPNPPDPGRRLPSSRPRGSPRSAPPASRAPLPSRSATGAAPTPRGATWRSPCPASAPPQSPPLCGSTRRGAVGLHFALSRVVNREEKTCSRAGHIAHARSRPLRAPAAPRRSASSASPCPSSRSCPRTRPAPPSPLCLRGSSPRRRMRRPGRAASSSPPRSLTRVRPLQLIIHHSLFVFPVVPKG